MSANDDLLYSVHLFRLLVMVEGNCYLAFCSSAPRAISTSMLWTRRALLPSTMLQDSIGCTSPSNYWKLTVVGLQWLLIWAVHSCTCVTSYPQLCDELILLMSYVDFGHQWRQDLTFIYICLTIHLSYNCQSSLVVRCLVRSMDSVRDSRGYVPPSTTAMSSPQLTPWSRN